jgi:hypothetical protein
LASCSWPRWAVPNSIEDDISEPRAVVAAAVARFAAGSVIRSRTSTIGTVGRRTTRVSRPLGSVAQTARGARAARASISGGSAKALVSSVTSTLMRRLLA